MSMKAITSNNESIESESNEEKFTIIYDTPLSKLFEAVDNNDIYLFSTLIDKIHDDEDLINSKRNGETMLMIACDLGFLEIVKFLLENGAETSSKDSNGLTAQMRAVRNAHDEIHRLLLRYDNDDSFKVNLQNRSNDMVGQRAARPTPDGNHKMNVTRRPPQRIPLRALLIMGSHEIIEYDNDS